MSYRCSLPSPLQKRSKDWEVLKILSFWIFLDWRQEVSQISEKLLSKVKKSCRTSMQYFVILGSLLQWRWQWASIGHFVFLFEEQHLAKRMLKWWWCAPCWHSSQDIETTQFLWICDPGERTGRRERTLFTLYPVSLFIQFTKWWWVLCILG